MGRVGAIGDLDLRALRHRPEGGGVGALERFERSFPITTHLALLMDQPLPRKTADQ